MADQPKRNVRVNVELELAWPDPGITQIGPSRSCDDETHDAIAEVVHAIIESGDPGDTYNMTVVVSESRPIDV